VATAPRRRRRDVAAWTALPPPLEGNFDQLDVVLKEYRPVGRNGEM
jgi:hypothetical protein